ncbi:hypothetical protein AAZX31_19G082400 [Glycine max]|uniref:1-phosphatidylinositol-4-phosphate 5-kinase n=1 Tax=Glycine max TaxID=3847 RepID=A0A0R0EJV8_SOYBN|nr:hypothetical protein JHK86_052929 [Glycine max]KAG4927303.1 hypothetical protein JHK85_053789 [Glycine max]KAG5082920.1 hypothetical protein JHK84_052958 [Glycine max]KAG5085687.1 hypothetical protein JHK82_053084 [Glycine max]KRG94537.1 hypothetical protein GLYMA_19G092000v4 [Glycine max]
MPNINRTILHSQLLVMLVQRFAMFSFSFFFLRCFCCRYIVAKHASIVKELRPGDFDPNEKFWTRFPSEGSKFTPQHHSVDFRWKDYCPMVFRVFRHLRELFYMLAICGSDTLREMSSPGKSGSIFYLTQDDRFIIKTVKKSKVKVLIRMLPSYYQHVF